MEVRGTVVDTAGNPISDVSVIEISSGRKTISTGNGSFKLSIADTSNIVIAFIAEGYKVLEERIKSGLIKQELKIVLHSNVQNLDEHVVVDKQEDIVRRNLADIEGTVIYATRKTEVVLIDNMIGNKAINQVRQVYAHVTGLTMIETNDGGAQLSIGARGLDPNRTSNFNTRQNGYDISADALGYPESYYTPPVEALQEIQIIRGGAALQYGPQFGGMINFKIKEPAKSKFSILSKTTWGAYNLFTNFTSVSGTIGKFTYYTHLNFKVGDGFRPNSQFNSQHAFVNLGYKFSSKTSVRFEYTFLRFLGKQPGGLTDAMFYEDPFQSNRSRNWFNVNWHLMAANLEHKFSNKSLITLQLFGLVADRSAVGFRPSKVSYSDVEGTERDLIKGGFNNWGAELRFLHKYSIKNTDCALVVGMKYYHANNTAAQGPGTATNGPDFYIDTLSFPQYGSQSYYTLPNLNLAFFAEHIFSINKKFNITPGLRFEYINTQATGYYRRINLDLAGNVLLDETIPENRIKERCFILMGVGLSYKPLPQIEMYGNISQNYRAVTYGDIRTLNPSLVIDENIDDEKGFTSDVGVRGNIGKLFQFDLNGFVLYYGQKIGEYESAQHNGARFRSNVGSAISFGGEFYGLLNLHHIISKKNRSWLLQPYLSMAITESKYLNSDVPNVRGNRLEFVPLVNLKTGIAGGYKRFKLGIQFTYISEQFTDAQNRESDPSDNVYGIFGQIPSYYVMDISASYKFKHVQIDAGVNNLLNLNYFTRRATGYPGPGILPSEPRTFYITVTFL